jgi:ubiquitin carboxyl-terminal hydrolase 25/28
MSVSQNQAICDSLTRHLAPRGDLPETLRQMRELDDDWKTLGLTPSSYTPGIITIPRVDTYLLKSRVELLIFAYLAQCRCDPADTMGYFTALVHIVQTMQAMNEDTPMDLQNLVLEERMRNRFTQDDLLKAVSTLGFGHDGPLKVDFDESVEEEFVINAWRDGIRRSWKDETSGSATRRELNEALRIIADVRGSTEMFRVWEHEKGSTMTVDTAYSTLGVSKDMDENTLITVFDMRVSETLSRGFLTTHSPKG